jgi:cadmium resistance protein CadD (predicted permease)
MLYSRGMQTIRRRARLQFLGWMVGYALAVVVVSSLFAAGRVPAGWRAPVGLLPMIPAVLAIFPLMDAYRNQDELQRKIQAEGMLFSFVLTAVLTFSYGFLERYADFPLASMFFVWPLMATLWCAGQILAKLRYR